jgi:hypothetical protein
MKTSIKSLICALTLGTTVAFAGPGGEAKQPASFATGIYSTIDGNLSVSIEKNGVAPTTVLILNANGDVLARERVARETLKASFRFDVSALPDGEYTLAILNKGDKKMKDFVITSKTAATKRSLTFE